MPIVLSGSGASIGTRLSPTASTTRCVLANAVLRLLGDLPWREAQTGALTASGTSLSVTATIGSHTTAQRWEVGDILEWREDCTFEQALVTAVAEGTLTIERGYFQTDAAAHTSGAFFVKRGRFDGVTALRAVDATIAEDLYPELFAVYESTLVPESPTEPLVEVPADMEEVFQAYQKSDSTPIELLPVSLTPPEYVDTALAPSGKIVRITHYAHASNTVYIQYLRIPAVGDLSDGMVRVVENGACARLLRWEGGEASGTRRAGDGARQAGQEIRDSAWFERAMERAKAAEEAVLRRRWPRQVARYIGPPRLLGTSVTRRIV